MRSPSRQWAAGWLIVGLTVLPQLAQAASEGGPPVERLEWLLATHDVRQAIRAPRPAEPGCAKKSESERR